MRVDRLDHAILEGAHFLLGPGLVAREQRVADLVDHDLGVLAQQVAPHPGPQRFERGARDTAGMLALAVGNQEGLERMEEQAGDVADARRPVALVARDAAQLREHELGAAVVVAAQHRAFQFADQQRPGLGRERHEILPQPFDRLGVCHRRSNPAFKSPR